MNRARLSAGVVVLHRDGDACRYLLLRCYRNWDFPKGMVEPGEAPFAAASREVREETSLDALAFSWGEVHVDTAPYAGGKVARYYIAESLSEQVVLGVQPELGRPEHHEFRWLTYPLARDLLGPRLVPVLDWAHSIAGC